MAKFLFTSESVTEGHPDKICDMISDSILDAMLEQDPMSRVACETCTTTGMVMVMGEITTKSYVDIPAIVRKTVKEIGYDSSVYGFDCNTCAVITTIDKQVYFSIGNSSIAMFYEVGLLAVNLLTLFFTVRISIMAIAIGAMIVELLGNIVLCIVSSKVYGYSIAFRLKDIWRPALCTFAMAGIGVSVYLLHLNHIWTLSLQIVLCLATYYCMSCIFNKEILAYVRDIVKNKIHK